jgi:hypothetical protein
VALIVEHHEELEHDLLPDFDLLDVWRGRLSFRRLEVLIRRLPADSAMTMSIDPDTTQLAAWDTGDYLLALIADLLGKANFQNWKPIPRPADTILQRRRTEERHRKLVERYEAKVRQH